MTTDSIFRIGHSHEVCQDYAAEGLLETGEEYVVLSDGCSGAEHSDWGSRILCQRAPRWIEADHFRGVDKVWMLDSVLRVLGLEDQCLLATLLLAKKDSNKIRVWVHGDGAVVGVTHSGEIHARIIQYDWSEKQNGALPGYLAYHLGDGLRAQYLADCNEGSRTITDESGCSETRKGIDEPDTFDFPFTDYKVVLLFSDGVDSFTDSSGNRVESLQVLQEFAKIPNLNGLFVKRSVSYTLKKMKARGWSHYDDLSVAGIAL